MWTRLTLALTLVAFVLTGCSYFKQQERLDLAPFAERTVSLAADIEYGMTKGGRAHYLRKYKKDPIVVEHNETWIQVRGLLRGVVAYSVEISTLGASSLPSAERNERFAIFLDRLIRPVLEDDHPQMRFTTQNLDAMLAAIREQKYFLDALREAQPFIDEIARLADLLFDRTQDELDVVADHLYARIEKDNAGPQFAWDTLITAQDRLVQSSVRIRQYKLDHDPEILVALYRDEIDYPEWSADPENPTTEELNRMADDMMKKLVGAVDLKTLLRPDLEIYASQQQELDGLYVGAQIQLKKARVTIMIWAKAHRNLAEGVSDAAKIDIFDVTKKAVSTVL
jgi:hypothetical protein